MQVCKCTYMQYTCEHANVQVHRLTYACVSQERKVKTEEERRDYTAARGPDKNPRLLYGNILS